MKQTPAIRKRTDPRFDVRPATPTCWWELRMRTNRSQQKIADLLECSVSTVKSYESGALDPHNSPLRLKLYQEFARHHGYQLDTNGNPIFPRAAGKPRKGASR